MTSDEMVSAKKWISRGAKLQIGRDYAGRQKIKISHGPLQIFTHRFSVSDAEVAELKSIVEVQRVASA
jgi:hypothetical protein